MALLAKLRPCGPWRVGPDSGDRLRVGRVLHSDALYSALTLAFLELGELDAWLAATALNGDGADVRFSSCFPFTSTENGDALFLPPPATHWPPPDSLRIRWESARFVTPTAAWQLLSDKALVEEHWVVDGVSECLLPVIRNVPAASPFRVTIRSRAAVDRVGQGVEPHQTACLEFSKGAGIWTVFQFASAAAEARWAPLLKGALKLIADSGLGGERSSGWGRFEQPEFVEAAQLGTLLFGNRYRAPEEVAGHWLLSLFSPAADDRVDWQQGNYRVVARTGRVESAAGWGALKRANQMIAEGGVVVAAVAPKGMARDVAPVGFSHPVYRAGFALTLPVGKAKPQAPKAVKSSGERSVNDLLAEELAAAPDTTASAVAAPPEVIAAPVVEAHAVPVVEAHAAPVAEAHAAPVVEAHAVPVVEAHAVPVVETHAAPVVETHAVPVVEAHAVPVVEAHAVPVVEAHAVPVVEAHVAPVVETHAAQVVEEHAAPVVEVHPAPVVEAHAVPVVEAHAAPVVEAHVAPVVETHHTHAPTELPAAQLDLLLESAAESPAVPEHIAPEPHKEAE